MVSSSTDGAILSHLLDNRRVGETIGFDELQHRLAIQSHHCDIVIASERTD